MSDLIDRQAAIDALEREKVYCTAFCDGYAKTNVFEKYNSGLSDGIKALNGLPSVDSNTHNTLEALDERKHGKWIDLHPQGDSRFMCSVCKWKEHVPTCMGKPTVWEYCPSCGARMDGDENG